jgi:hypothetical protein
VLFIRLAAPKVPQGWRTYLPDGAFAEAAS